MSVTSVSSVSAPYIPQSGFSAYLSANQLIAHGGTAVLAQIDTIVFDSDNTYDTSTYAYTIPVGGFYFAYFKFATQSITSLQNFSGFIYQNGGQFTTTGTVYNFAASALPVQGALQSIIPCAAGDTLQFYVRNSDSTTDFNIVGSIFKNTAAGAFLIRA